MNILRYGAMGVLLFVTGLKGFTQEELVDTTFNYYKNRILTIDEPEIVTILQEVTLISDRDGLDKNLVLQQLSDRITGEMQNQTKLTRSKWRHPSLLPIAIGAASAAGFLALSYWIYKKWDAPLNKEFDTITHDLQRYGVTVQEDKYTTYRSHNHVIHNHIIRSIYSRRLSLEEESTVISKADELLALRKRQYNIGGFEGLGLVGAILSTVFTAGFVSDLYNHDSKEPQKYVEKYNELLRVINATQLS